MILESIGVLFMFFMFWVVASIRVTAFRVFLFFAFVALYYIALYIQSEGGLL